MWNSEAEGASAHVITRRCFLFRVFQSCLSLKLLDEYRTHPKPPLQVTVSRQQKRQRQTSLIKEKYYGKARHVHQFYNQCSDLFRTQILTFAAVFFTENISHLGEVTEDGAKLLSLSCKES